MTTKTIFYLIASQENDDTHVTERYVWDGEIPIPIPRYTPSVRNHLLNHAVSFLSTDKKGIQDTLEHIAEEQNKGHIDKDLQFEKVKIEDI